MDTLMVQPFQMRPGFKKNQSKVPFVPSTLRSHPCMWVNSPQMKRWPCKCEDCNVLNMLCWPTVQHSGFLQTAPHLPKYWKTESQRLRVKFLHRLRGCFSTTAPSVKACPCGWHAFCLLLCACMKARGWRRLAFCALARWHLRTRWL